MKIGLLSDTHGYLDQQVFSYFDSCDEIWHAGDIGDISVVRALQNFKPLKAVYGNIDGLEVRQCCPENLFFECEGMKVFLTHIAGKPPLFNPRVRTLIKEKKPDMLICGHTHILRVVKKEGIFYLNPGACGYFGFHTMRTLLRFEINEGELMHMEVVELGHRQKS